MPRMPEIVGEREEVDPGLEENRPAEGNPENPHPRPAARGLRTKRGIDRSPLSIRLTDFSGEGERAPPA